MHCNTGVIIYNNLNQVGDIVQQEHPRGSIVETQGLHQDGLNSLSYNGLKASIIIAHVYGIL